MKFPRPLPFREALSSQLARAVLPTDLGAEELAKIDAEILRRAQFSAKVEDVRHLDELSQAYQDVLAGRIDVATARLRVKQYLARTGYRAEAGKEGGLQDFASTRRIDLQIGVNVDMMRGAGSYAQGQDEAILDMWPAQEFLRVTNFDAVERGTDRPWNDIWRAAGGPVTDAWPRMIALKDHPIWTNRDFNRFGNPWTPFDYGSGMGLEDVTRREAMRLGLIDLKRRVEPDREVLRELNAGVQATLAIRDPRLRAALEQTGVGTFDAGGVYRLTDEFAGGGPLANRDYARDERGRFAKTAAIAAGNAAVEKALATKADVMGAMEREDVGVIDFRWGNEREGLAHILKRGDARNAKFKDGIDGEAILRKLPTIIAEGTITERNSRVVAIEHDGFKAVLAVGFHGKKAPHWVLSSYDVSREKKGNR